MNCAYSSASNGNTAQTGELDLSNGGSSNTQTATSITFNLVLSFGQTNGGTSSTTSAEQTMAGTLGDNFSTMLSTYVSQWNSFDNGYHLVWERDMYEFSSALIVAGDTAAPRRAL